MNENIVDMKYLKITLFAAALLGLVSCAKDAQQGSGMVTFTLNADYEIADGTKSNVSEFTALPSAADFELSVADASSAVIWKGKLSEWEAGKRIPAGAYSVNASYGDIQVEGFDRPCFQGKADFAVICNEVAQVSVDVALANTVVKIACTDNFKNYYQDYRFELVRNGNILATFVKDETRAAFVDGYKFTVQGTVTAQGKSQTFSKDYTGLKEATAYTILFDAGNVGSSSITVTFNDVVETIDLGDVELND